MPSGERVFYCLMGVPSDSVEPSSRRSGSLVRGLAVSLAVAAGLASFSPASGGQRFTLDPEKSAVTAHTGKAGLFSFAGHEHAIRATRLQGEVVADSGDLAASSVSVKIEASSLSVLAEKEPPDDVPQVQAKMVGPSFLDVGRFAEVAFRSTRVSGKVAEGAAYDLTVEGDLSLHGVTRHVTLPVRVEISGDTLVATGKTVLKQTDFDLTPISVGGVVKVKNEVSIEYKFVAQETH
jgi:polyisoprenoid-binding protein YceI